MEHKDLVQRGWCTTMSFQVTNDNLINYTTKESSEIIIHGTAIFQVRQVACKWYHAYKHIDVNFIYIRFFKRTPAKDDLINYAIKFSCPEFEINSKLFVNDNGSWHLIHENTKQQFTFRVTIEMSVHPTSNSFAPLHTDEELTDFELQCNDGAVRIHRAVLALASPVFRSMLCGSWKEATVGHIDVPGTSTDTLVSFKDYVYLHKLPKSGLEQLLMLAVHYEMPELELQCLHTLVGALTSQNVCDLIEFAANNKITELVLAILERVESGEVKVPDKN